MKKPTKPATPPRDHSSPRTRDGLRAHMLRSRTLLLHQGGFPRFRTPWKTTLAASVPLCLGPVHVQAARSVSGRLAHKRKKNVRGTVKLPHVVSAKDLARAMGINIKDVMRRVRLAGVSFDKPSDVLFSWPTTAKFVEHMGMRPELEEMDLAAMGSDTVTQQVASPGEMYLRPGVVCVMGHVNHGKTTLLDAFRHTDVAASEHGGITQGIFASKVPFFAEPFRGVNPDGYVTFIDTPGHDSFFRMRGNGASVADVAMLVVAADEGIQPQTEESLEILSHFHVPTLVVINKVDVAAPAAVLDQLGSRGLLPEQSGDGNDGGSGVDVLDVVAVSAAQRSNLDKLELSLHNVLSERALLEDLSATPEATVLESYKDYKGRGGVVRAIVHSGTLEPQQHFIVGVEHGKIRSLYDQRGQPMQCGLPGEPVDIVGLSSSQLPATGDALFVASKEQVEEVAKYRSLVAHYEATDGKYDDALTKYMAYEEKHDPSLSQEERKEARMTMMRGGTERRSKDVVEPSSESEGDILLPVVLKTDCYGSLETLLDLVDDLETPPGTKVQVIHAGIGKANATDFEYAHLANGPILCFNVDEQRDIGDVWMKRKQQHLPPKSKVHVPEVQIRKFGVIYDLIEDLQGMAKAATTEEGLTDDDQQ